MAVYIETPSIEVQKLADLLHRHLCEYDEGDMHYPYYDIPWKEPIDSKWDGRVTWVKLAIELMKVADIETITKLISVIGDRHNL